MVAGELMALIAMGRQVIGWAVQQGTLGNAAGTISAEELKSIKSKAALSDSEWDNAVSEARARLEAAATRVGGGNV